MSSLFDKLNLRPAERRLVVIVGSVVFAVLNIWLVLPHFGDLAKVQQQTRDANDRLDRFQTEIKKTPEYSRLLTKLALMGATVAPDAQALELMKEVSSQAALSGVAVQRYDTSQRAASGRTNAFFDEQSLVITFSTGEKELVDFLYNLTQRNSLIRVRNMMLQPDPPRHRLQGNVTLVASYQKKPMLKPATPAPPAAAAKPASTPVPAPAQPPKTPAPAQKETAQKEEPAAREAPVPAAAPAESPRVAPPRRSFPPAAPTPK